MYLLGETDIVDETLTLFRANVFFRNFEIKNSADRLLVYLTLFTTSVLKEIEKKKYKNKEEGFFKNILHYNIYLFSYFFINLNP